MSRAWKRFACGMALAQLAPAMRRKQSEPRPSYPRFGALTRCRRGAVSVEYLMVAAVVGLSLAVTLVALGPELVMGWAATRHVLYGRAP
jgi:hypothetical protein